MNSNGDLDGLECPLCGKWFCTDESVINSGMEEGNVCGDRADPNNPCPGILQQCPVEEVR